MITDPIAHVNESIEHAPVLRGFSYVSPSRYLRPRQNSPLWCSSTARSESWSANDSAGYSFRLSLSLPCNDSTGVVQWGQEVTW